jgi:hypothetical protein
MKIPASQQITRCRAAASATCTLLPAPHAPCCQHHMHPAASATWTLLPAPHAPCFHPAASATCTMRTHPGDGVAAGYFTSTALKYWFPLKYCPEVLSLKYPVSQILIHEVKKLSPTSGYYSVLIRDLTTLAPATSHRVYHGDYHSGPVYTNIKARIVSPGVAEVEIYAPTIVGCQNVSKHTFYLTL